MGSFIINDNGNSGYSRADFISALEGLQPLLVSGQNIKTINSQNVLGSGNLEVSTHTYEYDLSPLEESLRDGAIAKVNALNPVEPSTGKRKHMMFGFITDLHTYPYKSVVSNEDVESAVSQMLSRGITFNAGTDADVIAQYIKDNWPSSGGYQGASAEHALRLLGAIGYNVGLDVVFCGGDLSDGRMPYDCYSYAMWRVKSLFDRYISVPRFFTDGNHDRWYQTSVGYRSNAQWNLWLKNVLNSRGGTYTIDNSSINNFVSNVYWVDFPKYKIRAIMRSQYEKEMTYDTGIQERTTGGGTGSSIKNVFDAMRFENPQDATEWTIMMLSHNSGDSESNKLWDNYLGYYRYAQRIGNENGTGWGASSQYMYMGFMNPVDNGGVQNKGTAGYPGKATIGQIYGHVHTTAHSDLAANSTTLWKTSVWNSFEWSQDKADEYHFSLFIVDQDNFKLYEIKVGGQYDTSSAAYDSERGIFVYNYRHH